MEDYPDKARVRLARSMVRLGRACHTLPSGQNREEGRASPTPGAGPWRTEGRFFLDADSVSLRIQNLRFVSCLLLGLLFLPFARAQQSANVILDSNEQLFCALAALNAAGYDTGVGMNTGNDTREQVRALLAKKKLPVLAELEKFYAAHREGNDAGADLGQYVSLTLLLGPPPDFRLTVPQTDLPPDAKSVMGLVPILARFYKEADLIDLWVNLQPRSQAEVERYSDVVRKTITLADAYFRFPSGAYLGRTYTIYLDLMGAPEQVQARIYGSNYFLVVTPSKILKINEIRHQYLHFLLDPLAVKYASEIKQKSALSSKAREAPGLAADFKEDFALLVTECLIRAAELRMDKRPKAEAQKSVIELTASGLILVPYFYEALLDYEEQEATMNVFYKQMILGIDLRQELKRLAAVKFAPPPVPEKAAAPAQSEGARLLDQGDNLIYRARYNEARAVFQTVLEKFDPKSERALFGLAVVASNTRKPDLAEEYFQKTLELARDLRLATWSRIYLGRLYDLRGKRQEALGQYRAASLTAGPYPEALRAVQSGLQRPFGSKE